MFKLFLLVSEHTINSINYFKNEKIHFRNLLRITGNPPLEKSIFEKFSEETDFTGEVAQAKLYFGNHNEVPHDNCNVAKIRLKGLLNRNKNDAGPWITKRR